MFGSSIKDKGSGQSSSFSPSGNSGNPAQPTASPSQGGPPNAEGQASPGRRNRPAYAPFPWPGTDPDPNARLNALALAAEARREGPEGESARNTLRTLRQDRRVGIDVALIAKYPRNPQPGQPATPQTTDPRQPTPRNTQPRPPVPMFNDPPRQPARQATFGRMDTEGGYEEFDGQRATRTAGDAADRDAWRKPK